ncbi:MAG: AMP-dependent synthetase/ligase [Spirochaetaceae bacterium]
MEDYKTLPALLRFAARTYDQQVQFAFPHNGGWVTYSTGEFYERVKHLALGLVETGVKPGESVGLIAPSSPEWVMIDLAIQIAGGITVPIFTRISPESFTHEIRDSGMKLLLVGEPEEIPMAMEHGNGLARIITFAYAGEHPEFEELFRLGETRAQAEPELFESLIDRVGENDLATIIYTSGSTGLPKGVELTQRNIVSQIHDTHQFFHSDPSSDLCLSVLPLAHIFERMVMYFYLSSGLPVYFVSDPKRIGEFIREVRPTIMTVVPRILEKVFIKMNDRIEEYTGLKRKLVTAAMERAKSKPAESSAFRPTDTIYNKLVYTKLREGLGGRLRYTICGSAKMRPDIGRFFWNIGIPVYEGYGLTEASPVIAANAPGRWKLGTVGTVYPSVEVKISEEGEVLAKGPNVMQGYHNNEEATSATVDPDGWLHTGDLGSVDEQGYLSITGRRKELFKKSTGEYVPPGPIERDLTDFPVVDTAVIFADNRTYVTALLFPDMEKLKAFKEQHGFGNMADAEFLQSRYLREQIRKHIDEINPHHHHCEWVTDFHVMHKEASVDDGELTPTLKVRRFNIEKMYSDIIENMYASIGGSK